MTNLGDITKISGYKVLTAEVAIGGSPCQDLSQAGSRKGLQGNKSVLVLEYIRVVSEMREKCINDGADTINPRYMVWENVPGALSTNGGEDFRVLLEKIAQIVDKTAAIPRPPQGKWRNAGVIMGDGYSIAWRVLDAQFWGVPQRRRRIALVADFGGHSAPEILFKRESVCGDSAESGEAREEAAGRIETGAVGTVYCIQGNCIDRADTAECNGRGWATDVSYTLNTVDRPAVAAIYENHGQDSRITGPLEVAPTVSQKYGTGGNNTPLVVQDAYAIGNGQVDQIGLHKIAGTLNCMHDQQAVMIKRDTFSVDCRNGTINPEINGTLQAKPNGGINLNSNNVVMTCQPLETVVRRLTPLECERLQGYPDGWTDIGDWIDSKGKNRKTTDTARYKALGNSIALPPWRFVLSRLIRYCEDKTMASLFDGIGGFPLIWQELGGKTVWTSEIEEFCCAVTERRFG